MLLSEAVSSSTQAGDHRESLNFPDLAKLRNFSQDTRHRRLRNVLSLILKIQLSLDIVRHQTPRLVESTLSRSENPPRAVAGMRNAIEGVDSSAGRI